MSKEQAEWNEIVYDILDHWTLVEYCNMYSDCLKFQAKLIHKLTSDNSELREKLKKYEWATLIGNPPAIKKGKSS